MTCKHCKRPIKTISDAEYEATWYKTRKSERSPYKHIHSNVAKCDDGQHYAEPEDEK